MTMKQTPWFDCIISKNIYFTNEIIKFSILQILYLRQILGLRVFWPNFTLRDTFLLNKKKINNQIENFSILKTRIKFEKKNYRT